MNSLYLRKQTDSFVYFDEGQRLVAGSEYAVQVAAREFREDTVSSAALVLSDGSGAIASCALTPDPLRRGLRTGTLGIAGSAPAECTLQVQLGGSVILLSDVAIVRSGSGSGSGSGAGSGSGWTVVDLGRVSSGSVPVSDRTHVKLTAPVMDEPLAVTPSADLFKAYVVITPDVSAAGAFPFTDVLVAGSHPRWGRQDSLRMRSETWLLKITRIAGDYYADLRAGASAGVETDPDGAVVPGVEVNS